MSAFPWGWLLLSTGASMIFQEKLLEWASSTMVYVSDPILLVAEPQQHPDHPVTPAVSCSSTSSTLSGSDAEDELEEDGTGSAESADESE